MYLHTSYYIRATIHYESSSCTGCTCELILTGNAAIYKIWASFACRKLILIDSCISLSHAFVAICKIFALFAIWDHLSAFQALIVRT